MSHAHYLTEAIASNRRSFHTKGITLDNLITLCEENPQEWSIVDQARLPDERSMDLSIQVQATVVHHVPSNAYLIHREIVQVDKEGNDKPLKLINTLRARPKMGHAPYHSIVGMFSRLCFEADGRFIWVSDKNQTRKENGRLFTHWPLTWDELTSEDAEGGE